MDKTQLVEKDIEDGRILLKALDNNDLPVVGAFWFYFSESNKWRLFIISPLVETEGPKNTYILIQKIISSKSSILLDNISVFSPKDELYQLLKKTIKTGNGISMVRLSRSVINGNYIEDILIYRIK